MHERQLDIDMVLIGVCNALGVSVTSVVGTRKRMVGRPTGDGLVRVIVHGLFVRSATECGYGGEAIAAALGITRRTVSRYRRAWKVHKFLAPVGRMVGPAKELGRMTGADRFRQDKACGPSAVDAVRRFGGVLEHPRGSKLFGHCGMPGPGHLPDDAGGITIAVDQVDYGHRAGKRTWLYLVGVNAAGLSPSKRAPSVPIERMTHGERRRTPLAFAEWLISLARQARAAS